MRIFNLHHLCVTIILNCNNLSKIQDLCHKIAPEVTTLWRDRNVCIIIIIIIVFVVQNFFVVCLISPSKDASKS